MSAIDPAVPIDAENASNGATRIRNSSQWIKDAWTAYVARHQEGSVAGDPGTATGAFKVPTAAPGSPQVGDFYVNSGQITGYVAGPLAKAWGDVPSGTLAVFRQNAAPTLWTRNAALQDSSLLRYIQSGNVGNNAGKDPAGFVISTADMPAHTHTGTPNFVGPGGSGSNGVVTAQKGTNLGLSSADTSNSTGGGGTVTMRYVDIIIASKDA